MTAKEKDELNTYNRAIDTLGLTEATALQPGHTGAHILRTRDTQPHVFKIGISPTAIAEVKANRHGYRHIEIAGGASLLPGDLQYFERDGYVALRMRYLGEPLTQQFKEGSVAVPTFIRSLEESLVLTVRPNGLKEQKGGLRYLAGTINSWLSRLEPEFERVGRKIPFSPPALDLAKIDRYDGSHSSLMLLDFTPDNVFFDGTRVSFIDPWTQDTYRGSCIPSVAQFSTLCAIYQLPQAQYLHRELRAMADRLGERMAITEQAIQIQWEMGAILQRTLSSFVRVERRWNEGEQIYAALCEQLRYFS